MGSLPKSDCKTAHSPSNPCPVCETGTKGCSTRTDGQVFCRGDMANPAIWSDLLKRRDKLGFLHVRRVDDTTNLKPSTNGHKPRSSPRPVLKATRAADLEKVPHPIPDAPEGKPQTWREKVASYRKKLKLPRDAKAIAAILGLPVEMFADMDKNPPIAGLAYTTAAMPDPTAGEDENGKPKKWLPAIVSPLLDALLEPCAIQFRFPIKVSIHGAPERNKHTMKGGDPDQGVIVGRDWRKRKDSLFFPEGPTCTITLAGCGLSVLGRYSNVVGAETIAQLVANVGDDCPAERGLYVLAENDERFNEKKGCMEWPGKTGALTTARKLSALLGRPVRVAFPPDGIKDWRDVAIELFAGQAELDLAAVGETIRRHIESTATFPPEEPGPDELAAESEAAPLVEPQPPPNFEFIDAEAFLAADYRREFHIDRVLSKGEQAVWAGPIKAMKTTTLIDAAVSMATATPFLGMFNVHRRVRVGVASGESGEATLQETTRRILMAKGLDAHHAAGWLKFCFDKLPQFLDPPQVMAFTNSLKALDCELIFIDPAYLCLSSGIEHGNIFHVGEALDAVAQELKRSGITPVIAHHANKQLKTGGAMDLQDMAYSGFDAYARQWVLLNRQHPYTGDGKHDLWMRTGGSAGHGGVWSIHIEEGVVDENFHGRTWDVRVSTLGAAKAEQIDEREAKKEETGRKKIDHDKAKVLLAIDAETTMHAAATKNAIRNRTAFTEARFKTTIEALEDQGIVVPIEFMKSIGNGAERKATGWKRHEQGACSELDVQGDTRNMHEHHADDGTP